MNELEKAYEGIERWLLYSEQEGFVAEKEISYLDYIKKHIDNLQSKIDKAIDYLYEHSQYNDGDGVHYIKEDEYCVDYLLDILKEDK